MRVATPPRLPDEPRYAARPTPDAARARYSRAPAAGRLTLRTTACGLFDSRRTAHPPHLAVGGPHAVVPNLVSTPPTPWPVLTCRRMAGFEVSTEAPAAWSTSRRALCGQVGRGRRDGAGTITSASPNSSGESSSATGRPAVRVTA